ncbi:MAG: 30S ribosomal protein S12 methylthiotransferase RimO [Clostridia bacterium]|nr:30S ribosomal protein S12 methylthiotransferase RimO [Clostridia bacterium]
MKVGFVSLGCSKNLIDTEVAIGYFKNNNYEVINNPNEAEIIVVNTCGFIESAKEEAINTILEMAEYKNGKCKYLIVMGCLVQRYYYDLIEALPEVDLFIRLEDYDKLWDKIDHLIVKGENKQEKISEKQNIKIKQMPMFEKQEYLKRTISTGRNYAYLKIGEGCSNMCTYCAIPYIRGLFISRPMEEIIEEAKMLAKNGIKEIIIIAQDTTKYGVDLYGKSMLAKLLKDICKIEGIKWVRFLYSYPEGITDELIETVKNESKICKYFDIPIQHISNEILKRMNRKTSKQNIERLIKKIRKEIPDVVLRTSLIVGFPGEEQKHFEELYEFVKDTRFDKLGVFEYSKEEGTPAANMPNQIHHMTKKSRFNKIMEIQQQISKEKLEQNIGQELEIIIEDISFDKKYLIGRSKKDAPDIDGIVYIKNDKITEEDINKIIKCKISKVKDYDMICNSN